ncbi:MAG: glycosyltransferase family 4 protein [Granulosicoccus sp.]
MNANPIAFYAPLKSPDHDVPSGDRLMARSLISCMKASGYAVETVSQLRVRLADPFDETNNAKLLESAEDEIERIGALWQKSGPPPCWFCYHPYYKSPDLIGPELCKTFNVPYVTAEASYSRRRTDGIWSLAQSKVLDAVNSAAVNVYFTERDKQGLLEVAPTASLTKLAPFISPVKSSVRKNLRQPFQLLTVAMMRPGDKHESYSELAKALSLIPELPWVLHVVGDGEMLSEVHALFNHFPQDKIVWHGKQPYKNVARLYQNGYLYVWPGCGEAYGLAYLEAQSAGMPVVAYNIAGVPEVVDHKHSGVLVDKQDASAMGAAISHLLTDTEEHQRLSQNAKEHVLNKHSFKKASDTLHQILSEAIGTER